MATSTETPSELLGRNVRRLRTARGMKQGDLADKLGMYQPDISDIETGRRWPSQDTLVSLAKALRVTVSQLLAEEK